MAATSPAATVRLTPAIVSRRRTAGSSRFGFGDVAIQHREVLAEAVELAQVRHDRRTLVVGQGLTVEPGSAGAVEQLGVRARRNQVRGQDRVDLVLHPGAVADDLVAPRHQRRRSVSASGNHTSGRKPAACSEARTPASILSVLTWA
jgi:hypothetical protein